MQAQITVSETPRTLDRAVNLLQTPLTVETLDAKASKLTSGGVTVYRLGSFFFRVCPCCHNVGAVGIGHDPITRKPQIASSLDFISRKTWQCRTCADNECAAVLAAPFVALAAAA